MRNSVFTPRMFRYISWNAHIDMCGSESSKNKIIFLIRKHRFEINNIRHSIFNSEMKIGMRIILASVSVTNLLAI